MAEYSNTLENLALPVSHLVRLFGFHVDTSSSLFVDDFPRASIDLSNVTKLKDIEFRCAQWTAEWVTMALQTVTSQHRTLQRIFIRVVHKFTVEGSGTSIRQMVGETTYGEWLNLDRLLV